MGGSLSQWVSYAFSDWNGDLHLPEGHLKSFRVGFYVTGSLLFLTFIFMFFKHSASLQRGRVEGHDKKSLVLATAWKCRFGKCFLCLWDSRWSCLLHT